MLIKLEGSASSNEWCLLEFQGELVGELGGNELGKLLVKSDGRAEMEIGQHFLEGSVVSLKQPFLIVDKTNASDGVSDTVVAPIRGCVHKKIIFKTRPKPLGLKRVLP